MTIITNNCEGPGNGVQLTAGNSGDNGAGDALSLVSGDPVYGDNTWSPTGSGESWRMDSTGNVTLLGWSFPPAPTMEIDFWFQVSTIPSATTGIAQIRNGGNAGDIQILNDGDIRFSDDSGAEAGRFDSAVTANTKYRLHVNRVVGLSALYEATLYSSDGTTVLDSFSNVSADNGDINFSEVRFGALNAGQTWSVYFGDPTLTVGELPSVSLTDFRSWAIDATDSVGAVTCTQTSGTTATIHEPSTAYFVVEEPGDHPDWLSFDVQADGGSSTIVNTPPTNLSSTLVYVGNGDWGLGGIPIGNLPGWTQIIAEDFTTDTAEGQFLTDYVANWDAYPFGWTDTTGNGTYDPGILSASNSILTVRMHDAGVGDYRVAAPQPRLLGPGTDAGLGITGGRFETRFRVAPGAWDEGYKVAWLLWPESDLWPDDGEIDFPEGDMYRTGWGNMYAYAHYANAGGGQDGFDTGVYMDDTWHIATTEWIPGVSVTFLLDGVVVGVSTTDVPNTPMRYTLQCETMLDGSPSPGAEISMEVDWWCAWTYTP